MSGHKKVLWFTCIAFAIYLLLSMLGSFLGIRYTAFERVNLIADVLQTKSITNATTSIKDSAQAPIAVEKKAHYNFELYHQPRLITNFNVDTNASSLPSFVKKLHQLKTTGKGKIRIAYLGDSMIEGDLMTETLRALLQQYFGGKGVGFVPVTTPSSSIRTTAYTSTEGNWETTNFKSDDKSRLFLSGYKYNTSNGSVHITDHSYKDSNAIIEKSLICGAFPGTTTVKLDGANFVVTTDQLVNRVGLKQDKQPGIQLSITDKALDVYGISFESTDGVFVDNFSFRGISGNELGKIDSNFLAAIQQTNPYDLIVLQYGVNVLYKPNDVNFNFYGRSMLPAVKKIKTCFPGAEILVISTADRAFNYDGTYKSAIGIDTLVQLQANIAYHNNCSFYNQFASMGGTNSIVDWANQKPALANKDYVHPNRAGAAVLARYFFEALYSDYKKYTSTLKP